MQDTNAQHKEWNAIPEIALEWCRSGRGVALATVVETWGSAPRPIGAQLVVDDLGAMMGSVSGGCVEAAVVSAAIECIERGEGASLEFGVADETAFEVGLACGGSIRIRVTPVGAALPLAILEELVAARAARKPVALVSDFEAEHHAVVASGHDEIFARGKSGFEGDVFVALHLPPLRLAIVGAVHIAQFLAPMAQLAGYDVSLIDPRSGFASERRFPGFEISEEWPDESLDELDVDASTAIVTLTHDSKLDDPALLHAIQSDAFYVGALGSSRTHAKRAARLADMGCSPAQIARIHGPVGLNIGAKTPAEIAASILAELIATRHGKSLRDA